MEYKDTQIGMKVRPTKHMSKDWKEPAEQSGLIIINRENDTQLVSCAFLKAMPGKDDIVNVTYRAMRFHCREITNVGVEQNV